MRNGVVSIILCIMLAAVNLQFCAVKQPTVEEIYTVTFDSQGGGAVDSETVNKGEKLKKPADPTKPGYDFLVWSMHATDNIPFDFDTEVILADLTLFALWEDNAEMTAAKWDKIMLDTQIALTKQDANYMIDCTGKNSDEDFKQLVFVAENKLKAEILSYPHDLIYCEVVGSLAMYISYDGGETFSKQVINVDASKNDGAPGILTVGYALACNGFILKTKIGLFDGFTFADGKYSAKQEILEELFEAYMTGFFGIKTTTPGCFYDYKLKIEDGLVRETEFTMNLYENIYSRLNIITCGGQSVTIPDNVKAA